MLMTQKEFDNIKALIREEVRTQLAEEMKNVEDKKAAAEKKTKKAA